MGPVLCVRAAKLCICKEGRKKNVFQDRPLLHTFMLLITPTNSTLRHSKMWLGLFFFFCYLNEKSVYLGSILKNMYIQSLSIVILFVFSVQRNVNSWNWKNKNIRTQTKSITKKKNGDIKIVCRRYLFYVKKVHKFYLLCIKELKKITGV